MTDKILTHLQWQATVKGSIFVLVSYYFIVFELERWLFFAGFKEL